jgi:hypothetical protein|tara:strand:- start:21 stop:437 length:417 start_codon:yes stop_codon:yes gene_type:complete
MITGFEHLHSTLRWVLLAVLLWTVFTSLAGRFKGGAFGAKQGKLGLIAMILMHSQLVLGLVLYLDRMGDMSRFFTMEHPMIMVLAVVAGTLGHSMTKRASGDEAKWRKQSTWMTIALLLVLTGIPWPFLAGFEAYGWI